MRDWQAIETAPKDGSQVLGWREGWTRPIFVHWAYGYCWIESEIRYSPYRYGVVEGPCVLEPTHWLDFLPMPNELCEQVLTLVPGTYTFTGPLK